MSRSRDWPDLVLMQPVLLFGATLDHLGQKSVRLPREQLAAFLEKRMSLVILTLDAEHVEVILASEAEARAYEQFSAQGASNRPA